MPIETMVNMIEWIRKYSLHENVEKLALTIHGGEPLMAGYNFFHSLFREINARLSKFQLDISVQSNLWLMDEAFAKLFKENNVSIGTSIDGPRLICDKQRGKGYFDKTNRGIKIAEKFGLNLGYICTFTEASKEKINEIFDFFNEIEAVVNIHGCLPSLTGVTNSKLILTPEKLRELLKDCFELYLKSLEKNQPLSVSTLNNMCQSVIRKNSTICTFTKCLGNFFAIDPKGNIFPCQRFTGSIYSFCNISEFPTKTKIMSTKTWKLFENRENQIADECSSCSHYLYCSGGCPYSALSNENGVFKSARDPNCIAYKSLFDQISKKIKADFFSPENLQAIAQHPYAESPKNVLRIGSMAKIINKNFHPKSMIENARRCLSLVALGTISSSYFREITKKIPLHEDEIVADSIFIHLAQKLLDVGLFTKKTDAINLFRSFMKDNVGIATPSKCYIHITSACNLKCKHCYITPSNEDDEYLQVNAIISLIRQAARAGSNKIILTGGEPFLHPERKRLWESLANLKKYWNTLTSETFHPKIFLRTNMTLKLSSEELELIGKAVDTVVVSVDGTEKAHNERRGEETYELTIKNVKNFISVKPMCTIRLGAILSPSDARGELGNHIKKLGKELKIPVKIRNFYPIGNSKKMRENSCAEPLWANITPEEALQSGEFFGSLSCGIGKTLDVRPNGSIHPCFAFQTLPYKLDKIAQNLDGLKKLYATNPKLDALKHLTVDFNSTCSNCTIRYLCHGPCKAWSEAFSLENLNPKPRSVDCMNLKKQNIALINYSLKMLNLDMQYFLSSLDIQDI